MAAIFGRTKFFWKLSRVSCIYIPWGPKISPKSLYLARSRRYKHFYVLPFLSKIRKFKMAAIFGKRKIFLKIEQSILHIYPTGQNFCRNRSISHGLGDTSNFKFYHFCQKFENSKRPPFLEGGKFFENWAEYLAYVSCRPNISQKSLYLARFRRYKQF